MGREGGLGAPAPHPGLEMQLALGNSGRTPGLERGQATQNFLDWNPGLRPTGSFSSPLALPRVV